VPGFQAWALPVFFFFFFLEHIYHLFLYKDHHMEIT